MSSAQDKKKLDHFMKLMKEGVDGMISLGHQAAALYYLDELRDSYGNPAMVSVSLDTAAVESHPEFHAGTGALEILKLPTPLTCWSLIINQENSFWRNGSLIS